MKDGFVFLDEAVPGIRWDAKYATWDNFTGKPVDGYLANRVVGSLALAMGLRKAQSLAAQRGYGLLLWDAYRPQRAVSAFLKWAEAPETGLTKAKFYPRMTRGELIEKGYIAAKSSHSSGRAVDLTLFRLDNGLLVPMGGHFDYMDVRSHHGARGLSPEASDGRKTLRYIMEKSGFAALSNEWWHYSLPPLYPDIRYDFPIAGSSIGTRTVNTVSPSPLSAEMEP